MLALRESANSRYYGNQFSISRFDQWFWHYLDMESYTCNYSIVSCILNYRYLILVKDFISKVYYGLENWHLSYCSVVGATK